jgi:hypothetical protein
VYRRQAGEPLQGRAAKRHGGLRLGDRDADRNGECGAAVERSAYRTRNLIERAFCRLKDWRRNAIQYDKPVATFASAIAPAVIVLW